MDAVLNTPFSYFNDIFTIAKVGNVVTDEQEEKKDKLDTHISNVINLSTIENYEVVSFEGMEKLPGDYESYCEQAAGIIYEMCECPVDRSIVGLTWDELTDEEIRILKAGITIWDSKAGFLASSKAGADCVMKGAL